MTAYREAVGPDVGLMLDVSFSQLTEGYLRIAQRLEHLNLAWLEIDTPDPSALALIRRHARVPIASLESLHGIAQYRPFLEQQAVDTVSSIPCGTAFGSQPASPPSPTLTRRRWLHTTRSVNWAA
jgi:L-alanine-DL-glutamate epimerase-like enolase superfamily enzyme